jgi:hypothetical protein
MIVFPSAGKLFIFFTSSPETQSQFQPNLTQIVLGARDLSLFKWKATAFRNSKNTFKKKNLEVFSEANGPISNLNKSLMGWWDLSLQMKVCVPSKGR